MRFSDIESVIGGECIQIENSLSENQYEMTKFKHWSLL